jgi:hypothetical protein
MNFYTRVLTRFVKRGKLKISVTFETISEEGIHDLHVEETKSALEELGLDDTIKVNKGE